jgi:hypothetical protein
MNSRAHHFLLIASTLVACWLGMQAVHELGHVIGAWLTRGQVSQVVLHPLTISRTDLSLNPHPLMVVWAGPMIGVIAPIVLWGIAHLIHLRGVYVVRFFAGFCLLANGLYIGGGSFDQIGECGTMLRQGSPIWHLWLFGIVTAPAGLFLWHRQGPHFGFGSAKGKVDGTVAYVVGLIAVILIVMGLVIGGS